MFPINFTYKSATDELIILILTYNYGFYCSSSVLFSFLFHTSEIGMSSPVVGLIYGRRQRQPTPVLLPGKSHGWRSLVGCSPWGRDWVTSLSLFTFMHWRKKWQPTPVFLPGESQGRGSLVGYHLWGCTELDTTEATWQQQQHVSRNLPISSRFIGI